MMEHRMDSYADGEGSPEAQNLRRALGRIAKDIQALKAGREIDDALIEVRENEIASLRSDNDEWKAFGIKAGKEIETLQERLRIVREDHGAQQRVAIRMQEERDEQTRKIDMMWQSMNKPVEGNRPTAHATLFLCNHREARDWPELKEEGICF